MALNRKQFGSMDNLSDRKEVLFLFKRLGAHLPEERAARLRARFLQSLIGSSQTGLDEQPMKVTPCDAVTGYLLFGAICGCLGVDIDAAARKLEALVR